jgi:hypothetical protein
VTLQHDNRPPNPLAPAPRFGHTIGMPSLVLLAVLAVYLPAPDAGAIVITVDVDGRPYLTGRLASETVGIVRGEDESSPGPTVAWKRYSVTPLRPEPGVRVPTEAGDPLHATLRGQIHINVKQSYELTVQELRLVRQTVDSGWVIAEDPEPVRSWVRGKNNDSKEVLPASDDSASKDARDFASPPPAPAWLWFGIGGVSLFFLVITWIMMRRNRDAD